MLLARAQPVLCSFVSFFNDTPPPGIYTLSLHDALPICVRVIRGARPGPRQLRRRRLSPASCRLARPPHRRGPESDDTTRSEEHTSELQSHVNLVCRLLLEKKKISLRASPNR